MNYKKYALDNFIFWLLLIIIKMISIWWNLNRTSKTSRPLIREAEGSNWVEPSMKTNCN
jgi:hypothetical protein